MHRYSPILAALALVGRGYRVASDTGRLLDGALPLFDREASAEKRRERAGKALRQITAQERAKAVRDALAEATKVLTR